MTKKMKLKVEGQIAELVKNPDKAQALGSNGREWVRQHFLVTRQIKDYLALFNSLYEEQSTENSVVMKN